MRKIYWYISAYIRKQGLNLVLSILFSILFFNIFYPFFERKFPLKKREYIGIIGVYTLVDLPEEVKKNISVGLTKIDSKKEVKPLLAKRWTVEEDGKIYRFLLKKNIYWQDGKKIVPSDIQYSFRDTKVIYNDNEVIFKLPEVFSPFPTVVSEPLYRVVNQKYFWYLERPMVIGIGNTKVVDYRQKNGRLKEIVIENKDEKKIFRIYLTERDLINAFKKGEVDILEDVLYIKPFENMGNVKIEKTLRTDRYLALFFDNSNKFLTKNVRQAFSYALSKPNDETRVINPIDKNCWAYIEVSRRYDKDMNKAVDKLLQEPIMEPISLEMTVVSMYYDTAKLYKTELEELGQKAYEKCMNDQEIKDKKTCENYKIKINLKITNFYNLDDFDLLLMATEIPPDPDQYLIWHSDLPTNFTHYKNTKIDKLLEEGRTKIDINERKKIYQEFQQVLLEDPPAVFIKNIYSYKIQRVHKI